MYFQRQSITFLFIYTLILQNVSSCPSQCALCQQSTTNCQACVQGFEISHNARCISSTVVQNCQIYGPRNTCSICKPMYRLLMNNTCVVMSDGCIIAGPSQMCSKCMPGSTRNVVGKCSNKNLNCQIIDFMTYECKTCKLGYNLASGICFNNDVNCQMTDPMSGLCLFCRRGYKLLSYRCIRQAEFPNCYYISQDFKSCVYCKSGYQLYLGKCYTMANIGSFFIQKYGQQKKCDINHFYNDAKSLCQPIPALCDKFDYGIGKCQFCLFPYIPLRDSCLDPSLKYCKVFIQKNATCVQCEKNFFLARNNVCKIVPPFCQKISNEKCVKCINLFLLNSKNQCQDPNCQQVDSLTTLCRKCKQQYKKNQTNNICVYNQVNCEEFKQGLCVRCREGYFYDQNKNFCRQTDPNCKLYINSICQECILNYYYNSKLQLCMENPFKCKVTDDSGNCQICLEGFALLSDRTCKQIQNVSNCQSASSSNLSACQKCKSGYYQNQGVCIQFSIFCQKFDSEKKICTECNSFSTLKNGNCFDNFCQYSTEAAQCLGCKPGYQFGSKGQCIQQKKDPSCKQFSKNICVTCSERYYFDYQWKCAPVNPLCQNFDPNNGDCTSCYPGYYLQRGKCLREPQIICQIVDSQNRLKCSKCKFGYSLNQKFGLCSYNQNGCISKNKLNNQCNKCLQSYVLDEKHGVCLRINTTNNKNQSSQYFNYIDQNCAVYSSDTLTCSQCIQSMYFNPNFNKCVQIDPNCKSYIKSTGECTACYDGYSISQTKTSCEIAKNIDKNCKSFDKNNPSKCVECFSGFIWNQERNQCGVADQLCKSIETNGDCLSCWDGYILKDGKCILDIHNQHKNQNQIAYEQKNITINIPNCQQYDQMEKRCIKCINNTAYDIKLLKCIKPLLGLDIYCTQYQNSRCTKCQQGYQLDQKIRCIKIKNS